MTQQNQQNVEGDRNQTIANMTGGIAIANVEQYIEQLIQNFHLSPQEILSLENFWANWSLDTKPSLSPSLVIGGREEAKDKVITWLRDRPDELPLQGESLEEAIVFFTAVIQSLDEPERCKNLSRAVVVDGVTSWQNLITTSEPLILIARLHQPEGVGRAIQNGHHVFIPVGRIGGSRDLVSLPRIIRDAAEQSLKEMGFNQKKARDLATLARRSLPAFRRKLAICASIQQPTWAQSREARDLLAPLLASTWDDSSSGDREVLARLSGMPYEDLQSILVHWVHEPDPPIRKVGEIWTIAAQEDAWRLLARYLTDDDLQRFETVAIDILGELDPAFELPPEQRYAASVYGKVLTRSNYLREGIAETLALMAALSDDIRFTSNRTGEEVARKIVWQLMEKAKNNESLWASLSGQLPLLAEAAPDIFLTAVDESLKGENPILVGLFQDKTLDAFMSFSPHTGLLWALETLAWSPDYLSWATLCLARLARLDPGGRLVNRPTQSLLDIFLCWHPNTTASLESRLTILDTLRKQEPKVAWHLLMALLPKHHSSVSPTHETRWRDWVSDSQREITDRECIEATTRIWKWLISDAGTNPNRWCRLIVAMREMIPDQIEMVLQHLEALDSQQFSSQERIQICDRLRREIVSHRDFASAAWAMPSELVQRLEEVYARFEPNNPIDRNCWLFGHRIEIQGMLDSSWQERDKAIENLRAEALREVLSTDGWEGVLKLAERVREPSLIGQTLVLAEILPIDLASFVQENLASPEAWRSQMAHRFVGISAYRYGEPWIEDCLTSTTLTSKQYGEFLLCLPFNLHLLDRLDSADDEVQRDFWSHTQKANLLEGRAEHVLTQLLKVKRPHLAIDLIAWDIRQTPKLISPEWIAEVLERAIRTSLIPDCDTSLFVHNSADLLNYLEKTDLSRERLATLEWLYFRMHEYDRPPKLLYEELSKNPVFFIEVLQYIFGSEHEPTEEISDQTKALAQLAWDILESWKQMPGVQEDRSVDAEALRAWVMRARALAAECDRVKVADIYIGHSLAFSPKDPDEIWPHQAVRDLIEELANPVVERNWRVQIYNNRGVTTRGVTDGGEQERTLVRRYEGYARQITDRWPRTAAVLRQMADSYRREATECDLRAERTQDFWR